MGLTPREGARKERRKGGREEGRMGDREVGWVEVS